MAHFCKLLICSFATTSDKSAVVYSSHYISLILFKFLLKLKHVLFWAFNCFLLWLLVILLFLFCIIPLLVIILFDFFSFIFFLSFFLAFLWEYSEKMYGQSNIYNKRGCGGGWVQWKVIHFIQASKRYDQICLYEAIYIYSLTAQWDHPYGRLIL